MPSKKKVRKTQPGVTITAIGNTATNGGQQFFGPVTYTTENKSDEEFLGSLEPCDFTIIRKERKLTPGTCEWIARLDQYEDWSSQKNILWIFGKPGSGKSYISQYICKRLEEQKIALMYFIFDSKSEHTKDLRSLKKFYQTIAHQLLIQLPRAKSDPKAKWFTTARQKILEDAMSPKSLIDATRYILAKIKPAYLIVDALDECADANAEGLQEWLEEIQKFPNLQIVITSRPLQHIKKIAENDEYICSYIHLQLDSVIEKSKKDIELFIKHRLQKSDSLSPEMSRIEDMLKEKSNGMILYTRLMLDILEATAGDEDELLNELALLPAELGKLYAKRLEEIKPKSNKEFASKIFQWLVTCKRPPKVDGLRGVDVIRKAINTQKLELDRKSPPKSMEEKSFRHFLQKECAPLVEILTDDTVRLVHTTVAQFLKGEDLEEDSTICPPPFLVQLVDSHKFIAVTCITYLRWDFATDDGLKSKPEFLDNQDLREYSVLEWPSHSERSEEKIMETETEKQVLVSFCKEGAFQAWLDARARLDTSFRVHFALDGSGKALHPKPLHIAVFFNLRQLSRLFLQDLNTPDATGSTPLHIAAGRGNPAIVQDLLDQGARMDIPDGNGAFPLHRAVRRGNDEALAELVSSKKAVVRVNVQDKYNFTPLHIACQLGWTACVNILLDKGAQVNNESHAIESPIGLAVENGHFEVVQVLLMRDKSLIKLCGKPLVQAARRGASKTVKFLCEAGADISYKDLLGQTALHKACISRKKDLVEYLLNDAKVPVDPLDQSQRTPLYFATERGYLDIVNCLIEKKANVNSLDRRNETALFKPAGNGHVKVVNRLLDAQTDATILDHWQRTPLRFAAMKGHTDIVRALLERTKIDQNLPDWAGRTVLHNAAAYLRQGQEHVIDVLFEYNAKPDKYGEKDGGTALHAAILRIADQPPPTIALIERLIKYGVPLDARDKNGRTALYLAAATRKLDIVELLLSSGAKPNNNSFLAAVRSGNISFVRPFLKLKSGLNLSERSWSDETALHIAASGGYNDIVAELLDAKAPVRCLDMDKMTPFMSAEKNGRLGAMQLLQNVDPAPTGDIESRAASHLWGRTALHWAAVDGQDLEKYILDDSTLNSQDDVSRTALHLAVLSGSLNAVQQLLLAHANMELADELGQTPLHYSSERVDPAILDALITANANINAVDKWSRTPLHLAAQKGYSAIARRLLTADAKLEPDCQKQTPLHVSALEGHIETARTLLECERVRRGIPRRDSMGKTVLHLASECGRNEILANLLEYVHDPTIIDTQDNSGKTALHLASQKGHLGIVQNLLEAGSVAYRIDNDRYMAGHLAAEAGHEEIVAKLVDAIPDHVERCLEKWDQRLPGWASKEDGADLAFNEVLFLNGALAKVEGKSYWAAALEEWTQQNRQPLKSKITLALQRWDENRHSIPSTTLMRAVLGGHTHVVQLLLQKIPKMHLQAQHYSYPNALSLAASKGYKEIASLLINAGSDVNAITDTQETCLHEAAENGHADVVELLLEKEANPDLARLRDGSTPLHLAAERGHADAVRALVRLAFLTVSDDLGRTPLHRACDGGHEAVVNLLLDADANVLAQDFEQKTPLSLARERELSDKTQLHMQEQAAAQKLRQTARN